MFLLLKKYIVLVVSCFLLFLVGACATFYQNNQAFQDAFRQEQWDLANKSLDKRRKASTGKDRLLYFFDKGVVTHLSGNYQLSNEYFTQADIYIEDFQKNYAAEMLALVTNPMMKPYKAEDFENVNIQYYKAKNYLALNNYEAALVEAKRLNEKLLVLSDKHNKKITYQRDAFGHLLMALIYDANQDPNNAFIAYRNAYKVYTEDYEKNYGVKAPLQLKKDILRTAAQTGLWDEVDYYEKLWNIKYIEEDHTKNGSAILFWENGFGPVKSEWTINFTILPGKAGFVVFENKEWGMALPFYVGDDNDRAKLTDLKIIRVAVPKFTERPNRFNKGEIISLHDKSNFELVQNINNIAIQNLKDRMARELATSLLRLALKQTAEITARQKNQEGIGLALNLINAITEKADTRNWQTLPHDIQYTRINFEPGIYHLAAQFSGNNNINASKHFDLQIIPNKTSFYTVRSF